MLFVSSIRNSEKISVENRHSQHQFSIHFSLSSFRKNMTIDLLSFSIHFILNCIFVKTKHTILELQELFERLFILCLSIFTLYYFSNRNRNIRLHPLLGLISICTFFMCLVFTKAEYSLGVGFGLFAVFSILRFRTETFTIQTIVFLFVSITLSLLDGLLPIKNLEILLGINITVVTIYLILNYFEKKSPIVSEKSSIEVISSLDFLQLEEAERKRVLTEKTKLKNFSYNIKSINLNDNIVILKVSH